MTSPGVPQIDGTDIFITRVFNAPRDLVFAFWMQPEHLAAWFGPAGHHNPLEDVIVEPWVGGRYQVRMVETPTGVGAWMHGTIEELVPPELLVVAMDVPHPIGLPPMRVTLRVRFHDHGERTVIHLHQGPFTFKEQREATTTGWGQSFEKLDALLAST